jgi:hypothetical protein
MHLIYRKTCRICNSSALTRVIDLGEQYLQGSFIKEGKENPPLRKIATQLVRCDPTIDEKACGLLQMATSVPPEVLYLSYWYCSGTNQTMHNHLKGLASVSADILGKKKAVVLDIGCNDGTLLNYYPDEFDKYGIDPSDITQTIEGNIKVVQDIFPSSELSSVLGEKRIDIITSIAMFYDIEDPVSFVENIKLILSDNGIWVFEQSYMPAMLEINSYDTICHEHLEYYSFSVIENLLGRAGMKVFKVEFNDINGGSIRCYATHVSNFKYKSHEFQKTLRQVRQQEFDLELDTDKPYKNFQDRINLHKEKLSSLLKGLKKEGKKIHVYGASTKGNSILQWCGIDHTTIDYASDRNPEKDGARTIGTNIPIISEEKSRAMNPDYYLVLPWHFREEFLAREKAMIDKGIGFIFPLPEIEIVKKQ